MDTLPVEIFGLPAGLLMIALIEALKSAGLPRRYAGITAIVLASLLGTLVLLEAGRPPATALATAAAWALSIVAVRQSVIAPVQKAARKDRVRE